MPALILAGGDGTRLRPLTVYTPKPIVPIVNRPFLFYQMELMKRAGIDDITLALGYSPTRIEDIFGHGREFGIKIQYLVENTAMGTAGAYKNAENHLNETTVVANGDILTDVDLKKVIAYHREKKAIATIVSTPIDNPDGYGLIEADKDGRIIRFTEKPNLVDITSNTINAGIYILEPEVLKLIPAGEKSSFEYDIFPSLLESKQPVYEYVWHGYWKDVGTPQRYLDANLDLINNRAKMFKPKRSNTDTTNSNFSYTNGDSGINIDKKSVVDLSCSIKQRVEITNSIIGPNCFIDERARIVNSVILAGARIGKATEIIDTVIGKSSIIGRFAKIESGILGDKSSLSDYSTI